MTVDIKSGQQVLGIVKGRRPDQINIKMAPSELENLLTSGHYNRAGFGKWLMTVLSAVDPTSGKVTIEIVKEKK